MFENKYKKILDMQDFGKLVSTMEYTFIDGGITANEIGYYRYEDDLDIQLRDNGELFFFDGYISSNKKPFEDVKILRHKDNINLYYILNKGKLSPTVYNAGNSPKCAVEEGYFEIELTIAGKYDMKFKFANDKHAVVNSDKGLIVFNSVEDGSIDTQSKFEEYTFLDTGYFVINYHEKYDSYVNFETKTQIDFKLMKKPVMGYVNHINQNCPTTVIIRDLKGDLEDREFQIKYDKESGLVTDIKYLGENSNKKKMSLFIKIEMDESKRFISLHPLLHDRFGITDISDIHKYWVVDYVNIGDISGIDYVSIERKIYELDRIQMYELFDTIDTHGKNIIYVK